VVLTSPFVEDLALDPSRKAALPAALPVNPYADP
jgi:hypothetical protein